MDHLRSMYTSLTDRRTDDELISTSFEEFERHYQGFRRSRDPDPDPEPFEMVTDSVSLNELTDLVLNHDPSGSIRPRFRFPWRRTICLALTNAFKIYWMSREEASMIPLIPLLTFEVGLLINYIWYILRHV